MHNSLRLLLLTASAVISTAQIPGQDFLIFAHTTDAPPTAATTVRSTGDYVLVNNMPVVGTMAPFVTAASAPSPQYLDCFGRCPTTSEYNPICGSDRQLYLNEQKFNCARSCGRDVQIVRRGSCQGLFPMQRG
ncbi:hypothetical protein KR093_001274 [Drosophila rubida]|uniref:Kazal-like domain-containing protein n=1 Tax=Drosophila rubida TaxID=30044 RepID=A0AAD4JWZ0_9MUSC|nr:hypothetical protein KR093_001274 [Drosophila rubida]